MPRPLHPNAARVADTLIARGHHGLITTQSTPVRTAEQAAAAVRVDIGAIVESLVFLLDDEPVLILVSGAHRVSLELTGSRLGGILSPAPDDLAEEVTGQQLGGVAPLGHPTNLRPTSTVRWRGTPNCGRRAGARTPSSAHRSPNSCG